MKKIIDMKNISRVIFLAFALVLIFQVFLFAQVQRKMIVKDNEGNPISGATVTYGERNETVTTNTVGEFSITATPNFQIFVEAEGYTEGYFNYSLDENILILTKAPFQTGGNDLVNVPFDILTKRQIPGAVGTLNVPEILDYSQENSVSDILRGRVSGLLSSYNIRGMGNPLIVINGIPIDNVYPDWSNLGNDEIFAQEIQDISVLKDLSSALLYGARAKNGVILITTKRGTPNKKVLNFNFQTGVNKPISYPEYLSSSDYMELYNEASVNDGLAPRYSQEEIEGTRLGNNPLRYPDQDYYNSTFLKNSSSYQNFNANIANGNEVGQFAVNIGWRRNNGLINVGKQEKSDRFNLRTAVDYEITDIIKLKFNSSFILNNSNAPRYSGNFWSRSDFWEISSTYLPNLYPLLIPASAATEFPELVAGANLVDGQYLLGGTNNYQNNVYGDLLFNGTSKQFSWLMDINTGLEFDLEGITEGLKASALVSFNNYSFSWEEMQNDYATYSPSFIEGSNTLANISKIGNDVRVTDQTVIDGYFYKGYAFYGKIDYSRIFNEVHEFNANALIFSQVNTRESLWTPNRYGHIGFRANYMYSNKFIAEFTGAYAGSQIYFGTNDNKYAFSPGVGLGWVLSEEDFIKNNPSINYLKLNANWSILNTDVNVTDDKITYDYYRAQSTFSYANGQASNASQRIYPGNPNLLWEKMMNYNIGFESMLLEYRLGIQASYFYYKNYDFVVQRANTLPDLIGVIPYSNYGSEQTQGVELGINHVSKVGGLKLNIGANLVYSVPKILTIDEPFYADEYRMRADKPMDARFGYVALGLFKDQQDIDNHVDQSFGVVRPGDVKYKDLNSDGIIDVNDQQMIGNSTSRVEMGLHLKLSYKSFELFALGRGQFGAEGAYSGSYYWVRGDDKYSNFVLDRWTAEAPNEAKYPRLTTTTGSNNFRNSTYWQYKTDRFSLQTVQLNYTVSDMNFIGLNEARFFLRGDNLVMLSGMTDVLNLRIGSAPNMRSFSTGVNLQF
tara:strand:+ start:281244 stop:284285 length:3042 start_codon:yes stop_codon:yes gene_type:complete